ncbi:MAG: DUF1538 domain-containing protein [Desulfotomaculaceae bacterium]|nr:DUF1538 domain-containing protein [Desulfotomaculaceae bacterium]
MRDIIIFEGITQISLEVAMSLSLLLIIFLIFQFFFLKFPWEEVKRILVGMFLSFIGLSLFLQGVHVGFLPTGTLLGEQMGQLANWAVILIGILMGFVVIIAEPAVRVLNYEVEQVSGGLIRQRVMLYTMSIGVAVAYALAMIRIIYGIPLLYILAPGYLLALIIVRYSSPTFISVAFDSGAVATGPMSATFIMAMAVGVASGTAGRDPLMDGFGLIALATLAPILSVLILGILFGGKKLDHEDEQGSRVNSNNY